MPEPAVLSLDLILKARDDLRGREPLLDKLLCYQWEADALVATGLVKEESIIRIPTRLPAK